MIIIIITSKWYQVVEKYDEGHSGIMQIIQHNKSS